MISFLAIWRMMSDRSIKSDDHPLITTDDMNTGAHPSLNTTLPSPLKKTNEKYSETPPIQPILTPAQSKVTVPSLRGASSTKSSTTKSSATKSSTNKSSVPKKKSISPFIYQSPTKDD